MELDAGGGSQTVRCKIVVQPPHQILPITPAEMMLKIDREFVQAGSVSGVAPAAAVEIDLKTGLRVRRVSVIPAAENVPA